MDILITTLSLINANRFCWESYDHPVRIREKNGAVYKLPEKVSDKNQTDHYAISRQVEKEDGTIVEEKEEIEYEKVAGRFTNEAPARYLLQRKLEETYTFFDKIIILGTSECKNDKIRDLFKKAIEKAKGETKNLEKNRDGVEDFLDMTTEDYYKWVILDQIRILKSGKDSEESRKPKDIVEEDAGGRFVFLNVDKLDLGEILRIIQEQPHADDDARIYMDLTGGTRVTSMTGIMLCRWLEVINYKLICAIYCDINGKVGTIKDITDIYGLFNAIIAHEKMYDPHLQHVSAENEAESAAYGLVEYRNNIAKKPACLKADSSGEPFIFISYSHMDHYPCQAIIQRLQSWGYRVWYDEGIGWGDYWEKTLKDHMDQCRMAIVLLSDHYIKSEYCNKELENLREKKKYVIRLGNVNPDNAYLEQNPFFEKEQSIPLLIDNKAEFTEKLKEGIEKLPEAVETRKSENK